MKTYYLEGRKYLGDGVFDTVEITTGTLAHCRGKAHEFRCEYTGVTIYEETAEYLIPIETWGVQ